MMMTLSKRRSPSLASWMKAMKVRIVELHKQSFRMIRSLRSCSPVLVGLTACLLFSSSLLAEFSRRWIELDTTGDEPGILAEHSAVFDAARNRLVIFGGFILEARDETFALDITTGVWSRLASSPSTPPARFNHSCVLDSRRNRMVIFGGTNQGLFLLDDVWAFDLQTDTWTRLPATAPFLSRPAVAVDEATGQAVIFGGFDGATYFSTTYTFDLETAVFTQQFSSIAPFPRIGSIMVVDDPAGRAILFGGNNRLEYYDDTWELDLATFEWRLLAPSFFPTERAFMRAVMDPSLDRLLLFGGNFGQSHFNETWAYDLRRNTWDLFPVTGAPPRRNNFPMVMDPATRLLYVVGGNFAGGLYEDVWVYQDDSFDSGSGLLSLNGEFGAVDAVLPRDFPVFLQIQARMEVARFILFADVGATGSPTFIRDQIPFGFNPDPTSPDFATGTRLICDTTGLSGGSGPLSGLAPPVLSNCPDAPAFPNFGTVIDRQDHNLRVGLTFVLQALIEDPTLGVGFGSTPTIRVTVVE